MPFKNKKSIFKKVFFFVVIFNILILLSLSGWSTFRLSLNRVVFVMVAPVQDCAHKLVSVLLDTVKSYVFFVSAAKENKLLKEELNLRRVLDNKYAQTEMANSCLRDLLALKKETAYRTIAADIISRDTSHVVSTVIINKGLSDGVVEGASVISSEGVVGNIIRAVENYSQVMLLTDPRSSIDALVGENNARMVAEGCGNNLCSLEYLSEKCKVNVGDLVVSSGLDKVFPKGVSIGKVLRIFHSGSVDIFERILIKPCVNFDILQNVIVVSPNYDFTDYL